MTVILESLPDKAGLNPLEARTNLNSMPLEPHHVYDRSLVRKNLRVADQRAIQRVRNP